MEDTMKKLTILATSFIVKVDISVKIKREIEIPNIPPVPILLIILGEIIEVQTTTQLFDCLSKLEGLDEITIAILVNKPKKAITYLREIGLL